MDDFAERMEAFDPSIFVVETQTSPADRVSLLRLQRLVRRERGRYAYLEIGSHLGGTLVPHLLDRACVAVHSVDPRPPAQVDAREMVFEYDGNSTRRMLDLLASHLPEGALRKLRTWDHDASEVPAHAYGCRFDLVLIDGEHTDRAAFSDFLSVLPALMPHALVAFHDANLVLTAIQNAERMLSYERTPYRTFFLPDNVAVIALRGIVKAAEGALGESAHDRAGYEHWARTHLISQIVANNPSITAGSPS